MYSIFCDGEAIYHGASPMKEYKVVNPKLTMSDNAAGSLTFTMPPENAGYSSLARLSSEIVVKRDDVEIWSGRVINEEKDFWNQRHITCEGELGYLNDTSQPPKEFHNISVRNFLKSLLDVHNAKASADKQFEVGAVTVTDPNDSLYRYTNYESTLDCIQDKLIDRLGGHLKIRKENGVRYLDYLQDYSNTNTQKIEFGKNLSNFTSSWDLTELATVVLPLGARLDESPIEALDAYLTVEEVNDGSIYIGNQTAINTYGWIETVVHWDDVTTATALKTKAQAYLEDIQFENMVLELSAVDMHYLDVNTEVIKLLDKIQCISNPHGMNRFFPVTKMELPLDAPENTVFTLGDNIKNSGLSNVIRSGNEAIKAKIEQLPSTVSVLDEAKENADSIMKSVTNGYITIVTGQNGSEKLIVSDTQDWEDANKYWEWSLNGLAYYKNKSNLGLALTMDGAIVADRITAGTLNADIIRAGLLKGKTGNSYWNLDTGDLAIEGTFTSMGTDSYGYKMKTELKEGKLRTYSASNNYSNPTRLTSSIDLYRNQYGNGLNIETYNGGNIIVDSDGMIEMECGNDSIILLDASSYGSDLYFSFYRTRFQDYGGTQRWGYSGEVITEVYDAEVKNVVTDLQIDIGNGTWGCNFVTLSFLDSYNVTDVVGGFVVE